MSSEWNPLQIGYALMLVATGSVNTLSTKWADEMESENSNGIVAFYLIHCTRGICCKRECEFSQSSNSEIAKFPKIIFYAPAFCDMLATSVMYVGLTLTYASSFQMLRGAVIVFTGLLSMVFLRRRLRYFQWLGIFFVIAGLVIVGLSDFLSAGNSDSHLDVRNIITGDILIIGAQIVAAAQMVIEEKFLTKYNVPPLIVVGWEGIFGFITLSILLIPFYWIPAGIFSGNPRGVLEDVVDAGVQLSNNRMLIAAILGNVISIAFFNFAGVSVTKELSATTRMVLDSIRTLVIWLFSLAVGWQEFQYLQPIGFGVLIIGMFLYNDVVILPLLRRNCIDDSEQADTKNVKSLSPESVKADCNIKCKKSEKSG